MRYNSVLGFDVVKDDVSTHRHSHKDQEVQKDSQDHVHHSINFSIVNQDLDV